MFEKQEGRRHFLKVLAASATLPAVGAACSQAGASAAQFGDVSAGNASSLAVGQLKVVSGAPACIGRDSGGIYAMTLTCTHGGCDMSMRGSVSARGIICDCHASSFDVNGNVTGGPAPSSLAHFAVSVDASGNLTVHGGQEVDAGARTKAG